MRHKENNLRATADNFDAGVAQRHSYLHEAQFHAKGDEKSQKKETGRLQPVMYFGFKEK
jgi:hypothetical protein